ncbi:MAG: hypothetical protein D6715_05870 [Calditrichaeota bacterium]|nr:MAG: hypothetical protein D6715_05870 [Calditrichota bacterium]
MKPLLIFLLWPLLIWAAGDWQAREFETIRMLNHRGEVSKVHLVSRLDNQLYLLSEKETLYRFDLTNRKLNRLLISRQALKEMDHFVALRPDYLLFSKKDQLFALHLPRLYLKEIQAPFAGQEIRHLARLNATTAILTYRDRVLVFEPEQGQFTVLPLPSQVSDWDRACPMADGSLWLFSKSAAVELLPGEDLAHPGRRFAFYHGREALLGPDQRVFLVNEHRVLKLVGQNIQQNVELTDGRGAFSDAAGNVWIYEREALVKLPRGKMTEMQRLPLPFSELAPILYAGTDSAGALVLVSPEYLAIVHDFQKEGEGSPAWAKTLAQIEQNDLWCFYDREVQAALASSLQAREPGLLEKALNGLAEACLYRPQFSYAVTPLLEKLPNTAQRLQLAEKIEKGMSGNGWAFALHLSELKQNWTRSLEDKIRFQMEQARLLAIDTANYPLAALKLEDAIGRYGKVIFQENLRDSLTFLRLKYSRGFPFRRDRQKDALWEALLQRADSGLLQRFARLHYFDRVSREAFQITTQYPASLDTLAAAVTGALAAAERDGLWVRAGRSLQFFKDQVPIHARDRTRYQQLIRWNGRAIGLTATGKLNWLDVNGAGAFAPAPPEPLKALWLAGQTLVGLSRRGKGNILLLESPERGWQLAGSLPAEFTAQPVLYLAPFSSGYFLLVTPAKAYRFHPVNRTAEGISLPPDIVTIYDCRKESRGGFYFATNAGLWHFNVTGEWTDISRRDGLPEGPVFSLDYLFEKSVLACLGSGMAGLLDASGWVTIPLEPALEPAAGARIFLDGELNAWLLLPTGLVRWHRSPEDIKNLVNRLLHLDAQQGQSGSPINLMPLVQKATRIQALSQWGAAFQFRLLLLAENYRRAAELLQVELSRGSPHQWLSARDALVVLDLLRREKNWTEALQVLRQLSPLLKGDAATAAAEFFLHWIDDYGPGYRTREKLELAIQVSELSLGDAPYQKLEKQVHQLVSRLFLQRDAALLNLVPRLSRAFPQSAYLPAWQLYGAEMLAEQADYQRALDLLPRFEALSSQPALKPVFGRLYWTCWLNTHLKTENREARRSTQ